jgi:hypothetical protein
MKMVWISYYVGLEDELLEILSSLRINEFTKWERVLGQGKTSGPHLGTHIWPKTNALLALAVNEQKIPALLDKIKNLKASPLGQEGIKAFIWPLEETI